MKTVVAALAGLIAIVFGASTLAVPLQPMNIGIIKGSTVKLNVPVYKLSTIQGHFLQDGRSLLLIRGTMCTGNRVTLKLSPVEIGGQVSKATFLKSFSTFRLPENRKLMCNQWGQQQ